MIARPEARRLHGLGCGPRAADRPWRAVAVAVLLGLALPGLAQADLVKVTIAGDAPTNGIFDPSVEYADGASEGWLSYSAVYGDLTPWGPHVETRVARSTDGGASWTFVTVVNPSTPTSITIPGEGLVTGVWNYEVSSLVHDPGDPGAEWKVFTHRIFRRDEDAFTSEQSEPAYSWITLRTASDPSGPWSAEIALMASGVFPPAPYDDVLVRINDLDPSLADLIVYSEPGAFEQGGVLYLSLTGLKATGADRIVLLASDDHGASWRYVGTPLSIADAAPLGHLSFDGSAVVADQGRAFLLVTPESTGVLHDGTLAFEFASLETAELVRVAGVPAVHLSLPPQSGLPLERRGGQADYHEGNTVGGLLQPAIRVENLPEMFEFSSTGQRLVAAPAVPAVGVLGRGALAAALVAVSLGARPRGGRARKAEVTRVSVLVSATIVSRACHVPGATGAPLVAQDRIELSTP